MKAKQSTEWGMGTVVLVDVVRSTELATVETLSLMEVLAKAARKGGSSVVKIYGDSLVSVFPLPSQAIGFAVGLHEDLSGVYPVINTNFRVGVATGELAVIDSDVFGSAINIASRLVQKAEVGQTLCDEATATLAGELSGLQKTLEGRWDVKGFSGHLQIYSLTTGRGTNDRHVEILMRGVEVWNQWRERNFTVEPNLTRANFTGSFLAGVDLRKTDLSSANLSAANLSEANFTRANLTGTNLTGANLIDANFTEAVLDGVDVAYAVVGRTTFSNIDLSKVKGLESVRHIGPSNIGIESLLKSGGKVPEVFLRGCGLPDSVISAIPALIGSLEPIQFYSCFISYSTRDEEFARRLHSRLREANVRVWFAPEDMKGGVRISEQIDRAIQIHDRLLIVLSKNSIKSNWMATEIRKARKAEIQEKRRKLFPLRLVSIDDMLEWECFDADSERDLAVEVREYFMPDFSNWKDHDAFEESFKRLLHDLRSEES